MSIARVWPNGIQSMPLAPNNNPMLASADAAALDAALQQAADKGAAPQNIYGTWTLAAGASVTLDSSSSTFFVSGNSSTQTGGRLQCGHNDFPAVNPTLSFAKNVAMAEMMSNVNGFAAANGPVSAFWPIPPGLINWYWFLDPSGSAYGGTYNTQIANSGAIFPLTRIHDGSFFTSVVAEFLVSSSRTVLPARFPAINVLQYDPFLNVTTSLSGSNVMSGWTFYPTPGSLAAYKNFGSPVTITATVATGLLDVSKYLYFVALLDEDYAGEVATDAPNEWLGVQLHNTVGDLHFQ